MNLSSIEERRLFHVFVYLIAGVSALLGGRTATAATLYVCGGGPGATTADIYEYAPDASRTTFATAVGTAGAIAFSPSGQLFLVQNTTVEKFASDGTHSTFAGGFTSLADMAFDHDGNLFVADNGAGTIFEFPTQGSPSVFASGIASLSAVAIDATGNLFAASTAPSNPAIYKYAPDGSRTTFADFTDSIVPVRLAIDRDGNVFDADFFGDINEFSPLGAKSTFSSFLGGKGLPTPTALTFGPDGNLYGASYTGGIYVFDISGNRTVFVSPGTLGAAGLAFAVPEPSSCLLAVLAVIVLTSFPKTDPWVERISR